MKSLFAPVRDQLDGLSENERKAAVAELDEIRAELDSDTEPPPDATPDEQPDDDTADDETPSEEPDDTAADDDSDSAKKSVGKDELIRRSEALLDGRDPDRMADPAMVAGNRTRLEVLSAELDRSIAAARVAGTIDE